MHKADDQSIEDIELSLLAPCTVCDGIERFKPDCEFCHGSGKKNAQRFCEGCEEPLSADEILIGSCYDCGHPCFLPRPNTR